MDELVSKKSELYADQITSAEDWLLQKISNETLTYHAQPHMLSGKVQGALLSMVSNLLSPSRILEIGTFTGYSALCLAKGLDANGMLHSIELRAEDGKQAQGYFDQSSNKEKIKLHIGNAKTIIPTLDESWDLVFIDADKVGYIEYYELILPNLKKNGLVIADNVLFHGQVLEEMVKGKNALAIQAFNAHVAKDERVDQVLLTVRDGLLFIRKK